MHARWSTNVTNIDYKNKKLKYIYEVSSMNETMNGTGIGFFDLENPNNFGVARQITGITIDNHIGSKIQSFEVKESSKTIKNNKMCIEKAINIYEVNKTL